MARTKKSTIETVSTTPALKPALSPVEVAQGRIKEVRERLSAELLVLAKSVGAVRAHAQRRVVQLQEELASAISSCEAAQDAVFAAEFRELMTVPGFEARVRQACGYVWGMVPGVDMAAVVAAVLEYAARKGGVVIGAKRGDVMFHDRLKAHVAQVCGMATREQRERNAATNLAYKAELERQGREAALRLERERKAAAEKVVAPVCVKKEEAVKPASDVPARDESKDKVAALRILREEWATVLASVGGDRAAGIAAMGVDKVNRLVALVQWEKEEAVRLAALLAAQEEEEKRQRAALLATVSELGL